MKIFTIYMVSHEKVDHFVAYIVYNTHKLKISITYLQI